VICPIIQTISCFTRGEDVGYSVVEFSGRGGSSTVGDETVMGGGGNSGQGGGVINLFAMRVHVKRSECVSVPQCTLT